MSFFVIGSNLFTFLNSRQCLLFTLFLILLVNIFIGFYLILLYCRRASVFFELTLLVNPLSQLNRLSPRSKEIVLFLFLISLKLLMLPFEPKIYFFLYFFYRLILELDGLIELGDNKLIFLP